MESKFRLGVLRRKESRPAADDDDDIICQSVSEHSSICGKHGDECGRGFSGFRRAL